MESTRQAKIARLLQKELSEIFRQQTAKTHGVIISVSTVRVSPDLSIAKAYLSVFPPDRPRRATTNTTTDTKTVPDDLAQRVRQPLRTTPELAFSLDASHD